MTKKKQQIKSDKEQINRDSFIQKKLDMIRMRKISTRGPQDLSPDLPPQVSKK